MFTALVPPYLLSPPNSAEPALYETHAPPCQSWTVQASPCAGSPTETTVYDAELLKHDLTHLHAHGCQAVHGIPPQWGRIPHSRELGKCVGVSLRQAGRGCCRGADSHRAGPRLGGGGWAAWGAAAGHDGQDAVGRPLQQLQDNRVPNLQQGASVSAWTTSRNMSLPSRQGSQPHMWPGGAVDAAGVCWVTVASMLCSGKTGGTSQ